MIRYIEIEAAGRASMDIRLPNRSEASSVERVEIWIDLYKEHYARIMKDAISNGDKIVVTML